MKRVSTPSNDPPQKRTKASQACASCRRQKSRCEILDISRPPGAPASIRCHRCKVLGVECSFETSDLIHFFPHTLSHTSPSASSPSSSGPAPSPSQSEPSPVPVRESYGGLNTLANVASSRPNVTNVPVNPIRNQYGMLPEDLVPTATTPVWGCVSRVDWTATPMLAIQELVRCPRTQDSDPQLPSGSRLSDILSPPEISSMLEIFETRYTPWLCAQIGPLDSRNSLLDIVRCTIASRHLLPATRSSVAPRLQKLTEEVFLREIFNPQPSPESIRALLILSVWTPICGTGVEARDGRLLIASAVSMAMNLHLQDESKRASGLRTEKDSLSSDKAAELNESTQRWRLWMYLSISESMLCIGTGRNPVSQLSELDRDLISISAMPPSTLPDIRDYRLSITAKLFNIAETALKLRLKSVSDLEDFFNETNHSMYSMEGLSRLFSPLPVITPHDTFYWQMLMLQYHAYRLLILHHALRETRTAYERDEPQIPWYTAEVRGHCLSLFWGHTALISAETVLSTFLTPSDLALLNTAPDNTYAMVGFAATWIFVSNYTLFQLGKGQLGGSSEYLQNMTIERLSRIAHAPDHAAARCGHVLAALMSAWEGRKPDETRVNPCLLDISYSAFPVPSLTGRESHSYPLPGNSDLFMDDAFWASFIENLNSDTFTVENPVVLC
ncbi:hypothetical protein DFH08DRAFT_738004 [Mycena albidolilacea]|uniref:Zn(2)-C6 fungal-type domain-containing protein n=1 Tax=Mycena albidolilacea TaxID=1033008 RepID=A0AAD7ADM7_9AGAR|nr:hypothetical protein DFH08DRAFT_738004 [Mycena albidolilacea]